METEGQAGALRRQEVKVADRGHVLESLHARMIDMDLEWFVRQLEHTNRET